MDKPKEKVDANRAQDELRKMRGKVQFSLDLKTLRADRKVRLRRPA